MGEALAMLVRLEGLSEDVEDPNEWIRLAVEEQDDECEELDEEDEYANDEAWDARKAVTKAGKVSADASWADQELDKKRICNYKTTLCRHFQLGQCWEGDDCAFAHGEHELRERWRECSDDEFNDEAV